MKYEWNTEWIAMLNNDINRGCVYFITDGDAVKIGKTSGWASERLKGLQVGNPRELKLLMVAVARGVDGTHLEHMFHERFANYRIRGEWFEESVMDIMPIYAIKRRADKVYYEPKEICRLDGYKSDIFYIVSNTTELDFFRHPTKSERKTEDIIKASKLQLTESRKQLEKCYKWLGEQLGKESA